jgi:hypothetical protein
MTKSAFLIAPCSTTYLNVNYILAGFCGSQNLDMRADEHQFYGVLVDGKQLIRVGLLEPVLLSIMLK